MGRKTLITRESEAWFLLARLWATHREMYDGNTYLCIALTSKPWPGQPITRRFQATVPFALRAAMKERIRLDIDGKVSNDPDELMSAAEGADRHSRVLACLMFGWEALDQERASKRAQLRRRAPKGGERNA